MKKKASEKEETWPAPSTKTHVVGKLSTGEKGELKRKGR